MEDLDVDRIILKLTFEKLDGGEGMEYVGLFENRLSFWVLVKAVMKFGVPRGESLRTVGFSIRTLLRSVS